MKKTNIITAVMLSLKLLPFPAHSAEDDACFKLDHLGAVGQSIWDYAKRIRGTHDCTSRKSIEADIDGDGTKDLFVSFIVEGPCFNNKKPRSGSCGDSNVEFLAIYLMKNGRYQKPLVFKIGGRGERAVDGISVEGNKILLKTFEYDTDKDPPCCPSRPGQVVFKFLNGTVIEEKHGMITPVER